MLRPPGGEVKAKAAAGEASRTAEPQPISSSKTKASRESAPPESTSSLSGPSFLGLDESGKNNTNYLLEDENTPGHGRMYAALVLLIVAGALIYWHWQRDGYPWVAKAPATSTAENQTPAGAVAPPNQEPASQPASSAAPTESAESTPAGSTARPEQAADSPAANAEPTSDAPSSQELHPGEAAEQYSNSETTNAPHAAPPPATTPSSAKPAGVEAPKPAPPVVKPAAAPAKPAVVASLQKPRPVTPAAPHEDEGAALARQGERYLYGNGVAQNCDLAQKSLLSAAARANAESQILLGTMYATGHCATRSLPSAYKWFAKALHQNPGNKRINADIEAVWREMTPAERQQAIQ